MINEHLQIEKYHQVVSIPEYIEECVDDKNQLKFMSVKIENPTEHTEKDCWESDKTDHPVHCF